MKKALYFAATAAVLASCSSDELEVVSEKVTSDAAKNGIVFAMSDELTRGEYNYIAGQGLGANWYSEEDRIKIFATKVMLNGTDMTEAQALYKATRTGASPVFCAQDDKNMLAWSDLYADDTKQFFAVYPTDAGAVEYATKYKVTAPGIYEQVFKSPSAQNFNYKLMGDYIAVGANPTGYSSVGEKLDIRFTSPLFVVNTSIANSNGNGFGKLKGVTVKVSDAKWDDADLQAIYSAEKSNLSYTSAEFDYMKADKKWVNSDVTGAKPEAKITFTKASEITDADRFYIHTLKAPRKNQEVTTGVTANKIETIQLVYSFENVDLTFERKAENDWNNSARYDVDVKELPYIVTKGSGGTERTLIVNKGKFSDILNAAGDKVVWYEETPLLTEVEFTAIKEVIINEDVEEFNDADWTALNKFTAATDLTMSNGNDELTDVSGMEALVNVKANKVTKVAETAFGGAQLGTIETLELDSATSVLGSTQFTALTDLNLGSYTFTEADEAAERFFNAKTQSTLVNVDIHSVTSLAPVFGYSRNILFTDYTKLKTIKLNEKQTIISANEFKGCTSLTTVEGVVEMSTAAYAFYACEKLEKVNVASTVIPEGAFALSTVKDVYKDGAMVEPTSIGENAFYGNKKVEAINLKNATEIGVSAFEDAEAFKGVGKNDVVTLAVKTVAENAFKGTAVVRFQLLQATETESGSLASTALKQIKYRVSPTTIADDQVTTKANVDIFIKKAEDAAKFKGYRTVTVEDKDWED